MLQKAHDTSVGDLARDALCDPNFCPSVCTTKKMRELLKSRDAPNKTVEVLEGSIETYLKYKTAVESNLILKDVYEENLDYYGYICEKRAFTTQ